MPDDVSGVPRLRSSDFSSERQAVARQSDTWFPSFEAVPCRPVRAFFERSLPVGPAVRVSIEQFIRSQLLTKLFCDWQTRLSLFKFVQYQPVLNAPIDCIRGMVGLID